MRPAGFPLLENGYDGVPFVYLDSASTTPKPREVIAAVARYYETLGANVHRGLYPLAETLRSPIVDGGGLLVTTETKRDGLHARHSIRCARTSCAGR